MACYQMKLLWNDGVKQSYLSRTWQGHRWAWRNLSNSISWRCATLVVQALSYHLLKTRCGSCWQICHLQDIICLIEREDHVYTCIHASTCTKFGHFKLEVLFMMHVYSDLIVTTFWVKPCDASSILGFLKSRPQPIQELHPGLT